MRFHATFLAAIASLLSIHPSISQIVPLAKTIDTTYHSVVAILRVDSTGNPIMAGSGVLIHPNVILTAGHNNFSNGFRIKLKLGLAQKLGKILIIVLEYI